tara:strand:- start:1706 stop:2284 length:579 start_codon:yes stop_codon:yes gene_type:complete
MDNKIADKISQSVMETGFHKVNSKNKTTIKKWQAIIGGSTDLNDSALDILSKFIVKMLEQMDAYKKGCCKSEWFKKLFILAEECINLNFESQEYRTHLYNTYWFYVRSEITAERRKIMIKKERQSAIDKMISSPDYALKLDTLLSKLSAEEKMVAAWKLELLTLDELGVSQRTIYRMWEDIKKDRNNFNTNS